MITIEDIKKLIAKDETRTLELKKTTGELYKGMETACAFLNSDGGWLMFGIAPSLKIIGQMLPIIQGRRWQMLSVRLNRQ